MPPSPTLRPAGFTLIELLTVIAIIGILAAILVPVVGRVRSSAASAACMSNLRSLHQATMLYVESNRGYFPPNYGSNGVTNTTWWKELFPAYCSSKDVFHCRTDETGFSGTYKETWTRNGRTLPNGKVSYGATGHIGTDTNGKSVDFKAMGKPLTRIKRPSAGILYTEKQHADLRLGEVWYGNHPRWPNETTFPHHNKAGFVFVDGHVKSMSKAELDAAIAAKAVFFGAADVAAN
jgi:prepilin-type N-terminal cleavage/methylation domain